MSRQMLSPVRHFSEACGHLASGHEVSDQSTAPCSANEGKGIVFPAEGCRSEHCKSVPSSFARKHQGTGLGMGENLCSKEQCSLNLWLCCWASHTQLLEQQGQVLEGVITELERN